MNSATTYTSTNDSLYGISYQTEEQAINATANAGGSNDPRCERLDDGSVVVTDERDEVLGVVSEQ
jgi:hypothetical protein